jgi:ATP-dependent Clp protease ATP-binding subunit ClpA
VKLETKRLEDRLAERQIRLHLTEEALDYLANSGFDPVYGARPLKRAIQRELETVVARGIIAGKFSDGDSLVVDAGAFGQSGLVVRKGDGSEGQRRILAGSVDTSSGGFD